MVDAGELVRSSLETMGVAASGLSPMSRLGSGGAYRVELADGRLLKARLFPQESAAARVHGLLRLPSAAALPRPVGRVDRVLVVEFVPGDVLEQVLDGTRRDTTLHHVRRVGHVLARLHRGGRRHERGSRTPQDYRRRLARTVDRLAGLGLLTRAEARGLAARPAPDRARTALTHGDACPENLVVAPDGALRMVDEERLDIRPVAFDLARTVQRWPLAPEAESALLSGYAAGGGRPGGYVSRRSFWLAVAFAISAEYRLDRSPDHLDPSLEGLRSLANDGG